MTFIQRLCIRARRSRNKNVIRGITSRMDATCASSERWMKGCSEKNLSRVGGSVRGAREIIKKLASPTLRPGILKTVREWKRMDKDMDLIITGDQRRVS